ncbi:hypothetical protein V6S02_02995 [Microbacterium sp. CCNWLW134]|uniref:hypothetical protein n=1 Tax=Microbacterium sp. CCNWLW134 TaxID=3122064 RepID=UPI00300F9300
MSKPASQRPAADLALFKPGNIINDATFFDSSTMSAAQIQSFLNARVPSCQAGYTCLKDWTDSSRTIPADAMCAGYSGVSNERAAQIIFKVAQSCGINPRVLLVTLQKEQGLVTHTWPSDWRYTIAMGQGCPDTAACDTRYYGFFNQVFGAAWQLKRYANPPGTSAYFTWYAPGKTWNIRFNPNSSCGSAPVFIENQATANLYYYTPYQPNAAALRAGYGEGDACSAYGNRNFFSYFVDWFGSTQSSGLALARTASNPAVFLLAGTSRWHVADADDYSELARVFGPAATVSDSFLAGFAARGSTGAVLHNASTGVMSLVEGGALHRIPTCEIATMWGAACGRPTTVPDGMLSRIPQGPDVGIYFRLRSGSTWGRFDSATTVTPLYNEAAARAANGDMRATPYAPYLPSARYPGLTKSAMVFAPGQLVRTPSDARVFMTVDFDRLLAVNTWSDVVEYGRTPGDVATVPANDLSRYRQDGAVAPVLSCSSGSYFLAGGAIHRLSSPTAPGLRSVAAAEISCAQYPLGQPVTGPLAVRSPDSPTVYAVQAGERRRVATWSHLVALNNGQNPLVLTVQTSTLNAAPYGPPIADGLLLKASGASLSLASGTNAHWLQSFDIARDAGIPPSFLSVADAELEAMTVAPALSSWLQCDASAGFAADGRIVTVAPAAAAGFSTVELSSETCDRLTVDRAALSRVFVKGSSPAVFVAEGGVWRKVGSWQELLDASGGKVPRILNVSDGTLAGLVGASG